MTYTGGSMIAGNNLEVLHEIIIKNNYTAMHAKRKRQEQLAAQKSKANVKPADDANKGVKQENAPTNFDAAQNSARNMNNHEEENLESEPITLDQTFMSTATLDDANTSGPKNQSANQENNQNIAQPTNQPTNMLGSSNQNEDDDDIGDPSGGAF